MNDNGKREARHHSVSRRRLLKSAATVGVTSAGTAILLRQLYMPKMPVAVNSRWTRSSAPRNSLSAPGKVSFHLAISTRTTTGLEFRPKLLVKFTRMSRKS